jgi:hypothetical protein
MVTTYETLAGRYVELLLPTVITYETLAGRYEGLLLPTVKFYISPIKCFKNSYRRE